MQAVGAVLVVAACGLMGLTVACSYTAQAENVKGLITMLQILETEISYARSALPEALARIGSQQHGAVGSFLRTVHAYLLSCPGEPFSSAWEAGLRALRQQGIPSVVIGDLAVLGQVLGSSDIEDQRRHLQTARLRLEEAHRQAEDEKRTNFKLWSYLGFAAGLLIILLVF
ncbi:MAG: hypothetical protein ACOYEU_00315 [Limnochordia bacterium]|jgi:stage III sporulation protein AB